MLALCGPVACIGKASDRRTCIFPGCNAILTGCRRSGPGGRNMVIAMPIQQDIRRRDRQGMPHAQIARGLGVDRGTVARYARQEDCSHYHVK